MNVGAKLKTFPFQKLRSDFRNGHDKIKKYSYKICQFLRLKELPDLRLTTLLIIVSKICEMCGFNWGGGVIEPTVCS